MNIKSNECVGFQAHSINPQRCRRCYKDINEHRRQSNPSNLSPISERKSSLKSRSSNVSIIPEKHSSLPLSSFTTKPGTVALREVETKNQNVIVENSEEKNEEGEEDEEEEEEEEAEEEEEEEEDSGKKSSQPVNVTFTVRQNLSGSIVPKSSTPPSSASSSKTNDNLKNREENINGGKWKQKIDDLEREMIQLRTEKKLLEDRLEKFASNHSTTVTSIGSSGGGHQNDTIKELRNKLIQSEKIIKELTKRMKRSKKMSKSLRLNSKSCMIIFVKINHQNFV
ncbi:hypothetical protein SSS_04661 [Sarcoptes scabiei]|nr:hypothetical protein SSS_04661 [Sarcoptes scabiei]